MGSALITPDLHAVGEDDWAALLTRVAGALGNTTMQRERRSEGADRSQRCQGHGRCYDLAPDLFGDDEEGYGQVLGDGTVPPDAERNARLARSTALSTRSR